MRHLAIKLLVVSFMLSGCAKEFPMQSYSVQEIEHMKMLENNGDFFSRTELARLYFEHNELEKSNLLLEKLVAEDKSNAEVLAWYGANNCKIAGKKGPWLLGIDKAILAKSCLKQIQDALVKDPENFTVQLIAMHTGAAVNAMGSMDMARLEMAKLTTKITKNPSAYTPSALFSYHFASALVEQAADNPSAAKEHLTKAMNLGVNQDQKTKAQQQLNAIKSV